MTSYDKIPLVQTIRKRDVLFQIVSCGIDLRLCASYIIDRSGAGIPELRDPMMKPAAVNHAVELLVTRSESWARTLVKGGKSRAKSRGKLLGNSREIKGRFGVIELRFHEVPALDSLTNDEVPLRDSLTAAGFATPFPR